LIIRGSFLSFCFLSTQKVSENGPFVFCPLRKLHTQFYITKVIAEFCNQGKRDQSIERKPRRNHFKIVTKEVRVLRILRKRKQITQYEASRLCGYIPGGFGHVEIGRITLTPNRIDHILSSLGFNRADFDVLMNAPLLRDDLIEECSKAIQKLDDSKLESALSIINALIK
jgi:transcriptional regulator with XRE-family HTH domain